jgi:protein associated with RNAse G/E
MVETDGLLLIRALKADGSVYRWWSATVESAGPDCVVTINGVDDAVGGPAGGWGYKHATRSYYWFDRPYNLSEVYQPDGRLKQIYIHIASPASRDGGVLTYTDFELDVVNRPGQPVRVVDEDEFRRACSDFGYSADLQGRCRAAVREAIALASTWKIAGPPRLPRKSRHQSAPRRGGPRWPPAR